MANNINFFEAEIERLMSLDDQGQLCGHGVSILCHTMVNLRRAKSERDTQVLKELGFHRGRA